MNNLKVIFVSMLAIFIAACGGKKVQGDSASLSLVWEMGHNQIEPGMYENTFYFVNNDAEPLENNWIVYFCQMPTMIKSDSLSPVIIEQISSSYFKMYPSPVYKPIASGDTLAVTFRGTNNIIKESNAPEGVYWVRLDESGKESAPQDVKIHVVPFTHDYQWSRAGVNEIPYPYGDVVYDLNKYYTGDATLSKTDIFPSIKSVENKEGEFSFTQKVALKFPPELANEAALLKEKLEQRYKCTVGTEGETTIELSVNPKEPLPEGDEFYQMEMNAGRIEIVANKPHGIFNATQTLLQVLGKNTLPYSLPNMCISDYPDLEYRGYMLDVARNFSKKENVMRLIDLLASYKMNTLHFHIADDEGWRLEIKGLEELTTVASRRGHTLDENECLYPAYGSGWDPNNKESLGNGFYTRADFIEILQYAQKRHVKVIPEIDLPGHARAAIKAMNARYNKYKDTDKAKAEEFLLIDFADASKYRSAQEYTDNVINVGMPSTYRFVEKVVDDVCSIYKEAGVEFSTFHLGGDEVPHGAWEGSPLCMTFMKENGMKEIRELKDYFIEKTLAVFRKNNIRMAAWQEVALLPDKKPNKRFANQGILSYCWNTVPEWHDDQIPYGLANDGYQIILCNVTNLYLDMSYNKHQHEPGLYWGGFVNEYNTFSTLPFDIYKSVRKNMKGEEVDINNVSKTKLALKPDARKQIEGIQGQQWAEAVRNFGMVEYNLFPKLFGLTDRAWNASPEWSFSENEEDYIKAVRFYNSKIAELELPRLAWLDVNFHVAQPGMKLIGGKLHMNCTLPKAEIRYTLDGSEPNENSPIWKEPIPCEAKEMKAKAFYCGKSSVTTLYRIK